MITPPNLDYARHAWQLIEQPYRPIDWHIDFKSGFRWCERTWYMDVAFGRLAGVDVKVPWELARLQHLPLLAVAYGDQDAATSAPEREAIRREFRNQALDFIATNPPRFGVNWRTAMDVGIRAANLLLAYDLFRSSGACFDREFENVFARSVMDHGRHIASNLEWDPHHRGNHYLANVVGLIFCGAYLTGSPEAERWLAFGARELVVEVQRQFLPDGGSVEASTNYHRLSLEMALFGTGLLEVAREGQKPLPRDHYNRLQAAVHFTQRITKPSGRVPQVGDNDSGRWFKLDASVLAMTVAEARRRYGHLRDYQDLPEDDAYYVEDVLDHSHLGRTASALFPDVLPSRSPSLDAEILRTMSRSRIRGAEARSPDIKRSSRTMDGRTVFGDYALPLAAKECERIERFAFDDFGLYVFRSERLYVAIRCGGIDSRTLTAHAHNDQLTVEIELDGQSVLRDPGSYLYTPCPDIRNRYRSALAHPCPRHGNDEPARLDRGVFVLDPLPGAACIHFGEGEFVGVYHGWGAPVWRTVTITSAEVRIVDRCNCPPPCRFAVNTGAPVAFSPGYGMRDA